MKGKRGRKIENPRKKLNDERKSDRYNASTPPKQVPMVEEPIFLMEYVEQGTPRQQHTRYHTTTTTNNNNNHGRRQRVFPPNRIFRGCSKE